MELRAITAILSPLLTPSDCSALASRFTRSCSWAKVRVSPSHTMAVRSGTTEAAIIKNSDVFILYLPMAISGTYRAMSSPCSRSRPRARVHAVQGILVVAGRGRAAVEAPHVHPNGLLGQQRAIAVHASRRG